MEKGLSWPSRKRAVGQGWKAFLVPPAAPAARCGQPQLPRFLLEGVSGEPQDLRFEAQGLWERRTAVRRGVREELCCLPC